ncbi:MAG: hypothetical protein GXO07_03935 [Crenarchaeota archaeon]|nr:hypothetical protein [Thermoproteota archaeon]
MTRALEASLLFILTISILIFTDEKKRAYVAIASAVLAIILGLVKPENVVEYLNLDVLGLIAGASVISAYLSESGLTNEVARRALFWSGGDLRKLTWALAMISGIVSLFIENVTTLIMLAPIVFAIARALSLDAVPMLLAVAFASNLGGAALLVGDPQSALAAGYFDLDFLDFIFHNGKPSIFWMVLTALMVSTTVFTFMFIKGRFDIEMGKRVGGLRNPKLAKVSLTALAIKIALLSFRKELGLGLSAPAFVGAGLLLAYTRDWKFAVRSIEWNLLLFLAGMFVLVGALQDSGVMDAIASWFLSTVSCDFCRLSSTLILLSVAVSAVVDNVPYLMAMFPVIEVVSKNCNIYYFKLLLALLIGATLGGNITYFGTSTNIAAVHLLAEEGYKVSFRRFVKYGLVYTALALASASALYYAIWG